MSLLTFSQLYSREALYKVVIQLLNKTTFNQAKANVVSYDNVSFYDFGHHFLSCVEDVRRDLEKRRYKYQDFEKRLLFVNKKQREVFVPTWRDRIVDYFLYSRLDQLLEKQLSKNCYSFRTNGLGIRTCIGQVGKTVQNRTESLFILRRDISNFYPSIDHDQMMSCLATYLDPSDFLYRLVETRIRCKWKSRFPEEEGVNTIGLPFGSAIACVLSNLYLTELDHLLEAVGVAYFRYADDVLVITVDQSKAEQCKDIFADFLSRRRLLSKPSHEQNLVLGDPVANFQAINQFEYLGFAFNRQAIRLQKDKADKIFRSFKVLIDKGERGGSKRTKEERLEKIIKNCTKLFNGGKQMAKNLLIDYYLYGVSDEQQLRNLDERIREYILYVVNGRIGYHQKNKRVLGIRDWREWGYQGLLHRSRLLKHGQIDSGYFKMKKDVL